MAENIETKDLARQFEGSRAHLKAVAVRMLGSESEAEDAVQDAWLRLERSGTEGIENLGGWLTTVVARVCLDMLRTRKSRREDALDPEVAIAQTAPGPDHETLLADSVGLALFVVLETLAPAERLAFVLHDMFDLSFDEIASVLGSSSAAARQLASRARRRVKGASVEADAAADLSRHRHIVDAFLVAARGGDPSALLAVLDEDVTLRPDRAAREASAVSRGGVGPKLDSQALGRAAVTAAFAGRARAAQPASIDGAIGAVWAPGGRTRTVFDFRIRDGKVVAIDVIGDPEHIRALDVVILAG